jgi:hypothetical protein
MIGYTTALKGEVSIMSDSLTDAAKLAEWLAKRINDEQQTAGRRT